MKLCLGQNPKRALRIISFHANKTPIALQGSLSKPVGYFLCMTHFQEAEMNSKERRRSFKICKITSRKVYGAERSPPLFFLKGGGGFANSAIEAARGEGFVVRKGNGRTHHAHTQKNAQGHLRRFIFCRIALQKESGESI
jgi:hypothetical protein